MSIAQILGTGADRPAGAGGRGDEAWGDLEVPGWGEFTGARDRFFASLNRAHHEIGLAPSEVDGLDASDPGEGPR